MQETTPEYDPYSYETDADPYPVYQWLRDHAPAYYNARREFWALSRFDDVISASLDWRTYSSANGTVLELMGTPMSLPIMIFCDPPRQTRLRNLVSKVFTPRTVAALEPQVRALAVRHIEAVAAKGGGDIVEEFTAKLPMDVISSLLGVPAEDRDQVRAWSNATLHRDPGRPEPPASAMEAHGKMWAHFAGLLAERRARPRDDLMTALLQAEMPADDGTRERLSDEEITAFALLLASAGNETVTKLLAAAIYWLWRNPDQRRVLVEKPQWIPNAVEETLRFDPPSHYQGRTLTREVELHGVVMPKGAKIALVTGATGRDSRRFTEPDRYDVRRDVGQHLAFGFGQHICLGAALARLESRIALEEFLVRFADYEVDEERTELVHSSNVRGFARLVIGRNYGGREARLS